MRSRASISKQFAAEEIFAQVLRKLVDDASKFLNDKISKAVVTVPAYFNDSQCTATKDPGRIAGLDVLRIINQPTTASLAYSFERKNNEAILVFDLGGGTFDVSVLEVGDGVFEVLSTSGDTHLGGDDFDKRIDEMELVKDLPEELRCDIKRYLCLDLIRKVTLFDSLDDLILDNICDHVVPLVFSIDEKIIREGDPVPRILFIVRGRVKSSQNPSKGVVATSILEPGGFLGDELLSWCLRRLFTDRLPSSSATFTCIEST